MLFDFEKLITKHNLNITGVIHIGAHECGEILDYSKAGIKHGVLVEANPSRAANLANSIAKGLYAKSCYPFVDYEKLPANLADVTKNYLVYAYAAYHTDGQSLEFNISNFDGGVDSLYEINEHGRNSSWAPYQHIAKIKVPTVTIDNLLWNNNQPLNFINIDVEGGELDAFKGATKTLSERIDYVLAETQDKPRFSGSCTKKELTDFLLPFGFVELDYSDTGKGWGDTLYGKRKV